jgi:hypothetical protein
MKLVDAFIGTTQSKYAAVAILIAMFAASLTVIFSKEKVPIGQKFTIVLLLFVITIPAILYTLFQMTCLVTGAGTNGETWWCGIYAWFLVILTIIYAFIVVVMAIMSIVAETNIKKTESFYSKMQLYDTFANRLVQEQQLFQKDEEENKVADSAVLPIADSPAVAVKLPAQVGGMPEYGMENYNNPMNMIPSMPQMGGDSDKMMQTISNMMGGNITSLSGAVEPFYPSFGAALPSSVSAGPADSAY